MFDCANDWRAKEGARISRRDREARRPRQPSRIIAFACKADGRDPRSQTRGVKGGKALASPQPQTIKAHWTELIYHKPLTMYEFVAGRESMIHHKQLMMDHRSEGCSSGIAATQLFALRTAPAVATLVA